MGGLFDAVSAGTLRRLADAFHSGQLGGPLSAFAISKVAPSSEPVIAQLVRLESEGMAPSHIALLLGMAADAAEARNSQTAAELVWTGPETIGTSSRDTAVVVQELWRGATRDVLVSTFVVQQVAAVFLPLAQRLDEVPDLRCRIFLHVARGPRDTTLESELLRQFSDSFRRAWPGGRLPEVLYNPRGLSTNPAVRATWHAKCVIVDDELSLITSANFTEWAHDRNVEAGVLVRSPHFAAQLRHQFDSLVHSRAVLRLPGV